MRFFSKESIDFLEEISENNNKPWFESNRHRYESLILEPSRLFVQEMGEELQVLVPQINAIPKINASLFRIFRDIRLSRDKTPLKSRIGIVFWRGSGKRLQSSSFYLHFSPKELFIACGIRGFSKDALAGYRAYIQEERHAKALEDIMIDLKAKGYAFGEPHYKRYPRGVDKESPYAYLSLYASMFVYDILPIQRLYKEDVLETLFRRYQDFLPLFEWIYALSLTFEITDAKAKSLHL